MTPATINSCRVVPGVQGSRATFSSSRRLAPPPLQGQGVILLDLQIAGVDGFEIVALPEPGSCSGIAGKRSSGSTAQSTNFMARLRSPCGGHRMTMASAASSSDHHCHGLGGLKDNRSHDSKSFCRR